ncbi:MipA/OmpV family protein [Thalassomonas viridans]|uniref:MipA/OmpV family protein n=1 Tax=Thalassomonas viridans TaxID=137584 RepID=A0AAF0C8Y3_9GAMM|nr:MipA/OmpV family protein [Thalassomonas viridans]WDE04876.1 MipA/OmpV family protein [Thalassomonas viridans]
MRTLSKLSLFLPLFSGYVLSGYALANDYSAQEGDDDEFHFAVMALAHTQDSIYVGGERNNTILPLPEVYWRNFYFSQGQLGLTAIELEDFALDLSVGGDFIGDTDRGDSKQLKDMKDLDTAITANIDLSYMGEWGELSFGMAHDISNKHDGYSLSAGYGYRMMFGRWFVEPSVGVTYSSKDVVNYYYGVSEQDVTADRALYQADSAINYELGLSAGYMLSKQSMVMAFAQMEFFDDEITDSPIVDDDKSLGFGVAYRYSF